ncbi:MAG: glycosyltransferase family 39 protein, partial [Chloroflexota bacterium]|nr:glycosyltransferase family 39 protein [Chloroflexota bacterium]
GCVLLAALLVVFGLAWVLRRLRRARPGFSVGTAVAVGLVLRVAAIAGLSASGLGLTLRGGDEVNFLLSAGKIAESSFDSGAWLPTEAHRLHEIVFAIQIKLGGFPEVALRVTQIGISMLGIILVLVAIHDLAGPRAARLGSWVLVLEPAGIFFSSFLHREPLLVLASGLVVFGGSKIWARLDLRGIALLGLGCAIATATRPYAGWFLIAGGLLLILHASLRRVGSQLRSVPLAYAVTGVVAVAAPTVLQLTSQDSLRQNLQGSQDANTSSSGARGGANSNNLSLERVDFSTRSDLLRNLPRRVRDIVLRPYPWQLNNMSQRLGAIGTLVVVAALGLLLRYAIRNRGRMLATAAPIVYPGLFLLVAYALSVGNAGTGFRYRTHLVLLGLAALVVLREHSLRHTAAMPAGQQSNRRKFGQCCPGRTRDD